MKAVYVFEQGGVEQMVCDEVPEPEIGPTDVLVRVRAASLNRRDIFTREGSHGMRLNQIPWVLGLDMAGEVARVGDLVQAFKEGDRVLGQTIGGAYCEYARANQLDLVPMPDWLSFEEAAAIPVAFSTAWHMLLCKAHLQMGEDVLVMAGGSGVGSAAIQIAKKAGARVITTASTDEKLEKAKALGADEGINYTNEDFAQRVKALTEGRGVDVVLEHIGSPVWEGCFASLKGGGRFVICGVTAGHMVQLHLGQLWTRDLTLMGTSQRPREDFAKIMGMVGRKELRGVVDRVMPLEEAAEAHKLMEESNFFGKIVLRV